MNRSIAIDGRSYQVEIFRNRKLPLDVPRIIVPVCSRNDVAVSMARICIDSIFLHTAREEVEIWVVDNNSPDKFRQWLKADDRINTIFNQTEPVNPFLRSVKGKAVRFIRRFLHSGGAAQFKDGSYANAIGLEIGASCIEENCQYLLTLHSDTVVLKKGWLRFLRSKIDDRVPLVSCWRDNIRIRAPHVGAMLFRFPAYHENELSFLPNIRRERHPDLPEYDVGDGIALSLMDHGFIFHVCANTYNSPDLVNTIPENHLFRRAHSADRCFDGEGDLFFAHLGRGTLKSVNAYRSKEKVTAPQWIEICAKILGD